jgi:transcriptional regulator with XRE-family HTH domain
MSQSNIPDNKNMLWRVRRQRGLERKQVAWALGHKSPDSLARYERSESEVSFDNAIRLSLIYRCSVEDLFCDRFSAARKELSHRVDRIPKLFGESHIQLPDHCTIENDFHEDEISPLRRNHLRAHVTKLAKQLAGL